MTQSEHDTPASEAGPIRRVSLDDYVGTDSEKLRAALADARSTKPGAAIYPDDGGPEMYDLDRFRLSLDHLTPREQAALQVMLAELLERLVKGHKARKRKAALDAFTKVGQREAPELDGADLGTVSLEKGAAGGWAVTDPDALLAWVQANDADSLVTETTTSYDVGASFRRALLAAAKADDEVTVEATGEVFRARDIPGIGMGAAGPPKLVVRPAEGAEDVLLAALGDAAALLGLEPPPAAIEGQEAQ